ncbi:DeoR family transcriptional regulator [Clostridium baratii]|uniref:Putative HTH-type transcriptional regulator FruR n=1 Tax=Clostridium baratii TaxID=1561 RepID=A0A174TSQ1_9CLOT|nr:DeoR/GlpR family DNA-binding transcription regulator [Clostridium baratii]OPF52821.1 DeoR family transcriptional regulator [Clostridium baratii]OPF56270.1 DeoR family transcriptional regulator [Clostridium baratii]OPF58135.1 DeoR family transcriptional regulator [Clostridium baratii]OPF59348.1 DeoR family transcriptional regulator [Clostridium baratii]CUQ10480.1 putative HTH-type transcriptional regulator FruR [Clostridium baratii]
MLSEERFEVILKLLEEKNTVTVNELVEKLNTSESTIRRDLNYLDKEKKLKKVHGGATSLNIIYDTKEDEVLVRQSLNVDEKAKIAKYAASLIEENDFVYIDAGTTTEMMIDYITETKAIYITNGIVHAKKLLQRKCNVYIIGGEIKLSTEAIVGIEAIDSLKKYNFTKGFFGTNGVDIKSGFTTPDIKEALIKREALNRSKEGYILADESKFNHISSVTFGEINKGIIITTQLEEDKYRKYTEVLEAK